jgi:hypothetical protein
MATKLTQTYFKGDLVATFGTIDMNDGEGEQRYLRMIKRNCGATRQSAALLEPHAWRVLDDDWCRRMLPDMAKQIYGSSYTRFDVTRIHDIILEALMDLCTLEGQVDDTLADEQKFLEELGITEEYVHHAGRAN